MNTIEQLRTEGPCESRNCVQNIESLKVYWFLISDRISLVRLALSPITSFRDNSHETKHSVVLPQFELCKEFIFQLADRNGHACCSKHCRALGWAVDSNTVSAGMLCHP